jgi:hypothetical protein
MKKRPFFIRNGTRKQNGARPTLAPGFALLALLLGTGTAAAAGSESARARGPDPCLANVPAATPANGAVRVVQLVNCSGETLLGAANAAASSGQPLTSVLPREGTWVMKPAGSPNNGNVLTIDIPAAWAATTTEGSIAPNIWARTGCRYDAAVDKAQCETGGAGGVYDTSKARLGPPGGATITEWTFYQKATRTDGSTYYVDNFDISAVNGTNLTVDIQAIGGSPKDPGNPNNQFWLGQPGTGQNSPMSVPGQDLRSSNRCPPAFRFRRSQLTGGVFGFVIVDNSGQPLGGDATVGCFSNCGKYKFPLEPAQNCDISDPKCYNWKVFCAGDPTQYGKACSTDQDCPVQASCWNNPGSKIDHTCQLRGFIAKNSCDPNVCTFPYGWLNPATGQPDYSTQPPFGQCSQVNPTNPSASCIGDDTVHAVFPHAYTWPNDPQTYASDAPLYRVVYAPGGTSVPITPSVDGLPVCSGLPSIYNYAQNSTNCSIDIGKGAVFAIARPSPALWSCNLGDGAGNDGVICRWNATLGATPRAFDGIPGRRNCAARSQSSLTRHYGGLQRAARLHGYAGPRALKAAVRSFCRR